METTVTFEKVVGEGRALAYWQGKALFCIGPLPGETARVRVTRNKRRWAEAELLEIVTSSPYRQAAYESHFLSCSPWQAVDYTYQLELKAAMLAEAFMRPDTKLETRGIIGSPQALGYRNKLEFSLSPDVDGRIGLAFHQRGDYREVVPAPDGCVLGGASMNIAVKGLIDHINSIDSLDQYGSLIVRSDRSGHCIAVLIERPGAAAITKRAAHELVAGYDCAAKGLAGLAVARRLSHDTIEVIASSGSLELSERLDGVEVAYPWNSFFQVNPAAFELALTAITALVVPNRPVVDLYGGVGTIGLAVAAVASQVTGVEINPDAVELAARNAARAGIDNYESIAVAAERLDPVVLGGAATIIVDPPRAGLHPKVLTAIRAARPQRIIYLSCNPVTQARDVAGLVDYYRPGTVQGFDFYPGTLHLESLVTLDRR